MRSRKPLSHPRKARAVYDAACHVPRVRKQLRKFLEAAVEPDEGVTQSVNRHRLGRGDLLKVGPSIRRERSAGHGSFRVLLRSGLLASILTTSWASQQLLLG